MTKHEICGSIAEHLEYRTYADPIPLSKEIYEIFLEWEPIDDAPKTNFEPGLVILSNGSVPFYSCFWSEEKQGWMSRIQFNAADGQFKTVFNKVLNPTHFRALPPIP
jgi:hypothetical protein